MKAIIIYYTGTTPTPSDVKELAKITDEVCEIRLISEESLKQLCLSPMKTTDMQKTAPLSLVNDAAIVISKRVDSKDVGRIAKSVIDILQKSNTVSERNNVFIKACKILAEDSKKISETVQKTTGINEVVREIIVQLYYAWKANVTDL